MRQAAAKDVEAGVDRDRVLPPRGGMPRGRARVVLHGVRLGRVVADRVVSEDLAVRQQRDMHADDRPVDDWTPFADVLRGGGGGRGSGWPRAARTDSGRVNVERSLLRGSVCDSILGRVAGGGHDAVVRAGARSAERGHYNRCDERDDQSGPQSPASSSAGFFAPWAGSRAFSTGFWSSIGTLERIRLRRLIFVGQLGPTTSVGAN